MSVFSTIKLTPAENFEQTPPSCFYRAVISGKGLDLVTSETTFQITFQSVRNAAVFQIWGKKRARAEGRPCSEQRGQGSELGLPVAVPPSDPNSGDSERDCSLAPEAHIGLFEGNKRPTGLRSFFSAVLKVQSCPLFSIHSSV